MTENRVAVAEAAVGMELPRVLGLRLRLGRLTRKFGGMSYREVSCSFTTQHQVEAVWRDLLGPAQVTNLAQS